MRALCIFCETLKQSNKNVYTIDFEKTEESLKPAQTKNFKKKRFSHFKYFINQTQSREIIEHLAKTLENPSNFESSISKKGPVNM